QYFQGTSLDESIGAGTRLAIPLLRFKGGEVNGKGIGISSGVFIYLRTTKHTFINLEFSFPTLFLKFHNDYQSFYDNGVQLINQQHHVTGYATLWMGEFSVPVFYYHDDKDVKNGYAIGAGYSALLAGITDYLDLEETVKNYDANTGEFINEEPGDLTIYGFTPPAKIIHGAFISAEYITYGAHLGVRYQFTFTNFLNPAFTSDHLRMSNFQVYAAIDFIAIVRKLF
ncbi:MAG TPA: hypothetical protein VE978_01260, partial [Chitinophagales bacterium]|nr:hypothetical protein [Chitinophagales bacterium]